jgi:nucleotide-binding universal stress UspA family protein
MFAKILVALDLSTSSQQVFQEACEIAQTSGGQLMLLHVLTPLGDSAPPVLALGVDGIYPGIHGEALKQYMLQLEETEKRGLSQLRSLQAQASSLNLNAEVCQAIGDPGTSICETARTWGADLIVLGRRGLSGLSELFLGSVSNYVLHHADCSVLTFKAPRPSTKPEASDAKATVAL